MVIETNIQTGTCFRGLTRMNDKEIDNLVLTLNDEGFISLRILVGAEMARRGISIDIDELGERLVILVFNSTPGLPNLMRIQKKAKNVDALSRNGERYSIKTILNEKNRARFILIATIPANRFFNTFCWYF